MNWKSILACFLACVLCFSLWGCGETAEKSADKNAEPILNVVVYDEKTDTLSYETISTNGQRKPTEEFELDAMAVLYADSGCFQQEVQDGKTVNSVVSVDIFDDEGGQIVPDPIVVEICNQTAAAHAQPILALDILVCGGRYFPVVDLDVDDQAPVILYYFNTETNTMTALCRFDSVVIGGLQITNPDNLP